MAEPGGSDSKFLNEAADLLFHYLVILKAKEHQLGDVINVLAERHKPENKMEVRRVELPLASELTLVYRNCL
ncbi:MAG: hypothetical protein JST10_11610 [Bacteroidetes bacterium]|nr:hypothetical protein [Bacteroidota bacterium]MBS1633205.1 hypothetical protein [Bacteroidota bacterium]